ncbi:MAG TPA: bifunctional oligoribonuclease/PAP phosphatase NrnA [Lachnospiraceae bacterium]|nr:bifunctional oligoribonuclease/PAP phosphatase NrnA [Lachnospiraceae bacterium]
MNLLNECAGAEKIGISAHIRPDGDAVGSSMALYLYLKKMLPNALVKLFLETPPDNLIHLKYINEIDSDYEYSGDFDVFFALDTAADRLGKAESYFQNAIKKINIDHHISNEAGCGDVNVVLPKASSTAEVLYGLMQEEYLDEDIAVALYTGIIHDCGVFQYTNTSPKTMMIGAKLISFGFPFSKIIEESFYQKTYLQNQILGRALMESIRFFDGRCIVSCIDQKMLEFYQALPSDMDGIVNQMRNSKGVDCAVFMYETATLEYKVSMRSNEYVDVAKVASYFGGGGHIRAAGCTMSGTFHDVIENLSSQIEIQLRDKAECIMES